MATTTTAAAAAAAAAAAIKRAGMVRRGFVLVLPGCCPGHPGRGFLPPLGSRQRLPEPGPLPLQPEVLQGELFELCDPLLSCRRRHRRRHRQRRR